MSYSSSPGKFRKPCGKRGPAPADDLPPKIPKYILCDKEMPPLSPAPSMPSPVKCTPVECSPAQLTTWKLQAKEALLCTPAKAITRSAWLLKLYAEGFPYANPFAQHMARLKVESGLSCFPIRQPASAALAAVASAANGFGQQLAPRPPQ